MVGSSVWPMERDSIRALGRRQGARPPGLGRRASSRCATSSGSRRSSRRSPALQGAKIPSGAIIRTVLKDISPDTLRGGATPDARTRRGRVLQQPSPAGGPGTATPTAPEDIDLIVDELMASKKDGLDRHRRCRHRAASGTAIRESQDHRNRSGVHIIVAGGYSGPLPCRRDGQDRRADRRRVRQRCEVTALGRLRRDRLVLETHPNERKMMRAVRPCASSPRHPDLHAHAPRELSEVRHRPARDLRIGEGEPAEPVYRPSLRFQGRSKGADPDRHRQAWRLHRVRYRRPRAHRCRKPRWSRTG